MRTLVHLSLRLLLGSAVRCCLRAHVLLKSSIVRLGVCPPISPSAAAIIWPSSFLVPCQKSDKPCLMGHFRGRLASGGVTRWSTPGE
ncbi:hypothetical protein BgiMline_022509 [Biomphalaria glabrata]|nr:hypothetical protein BgiMline_010347 [Biomphalaria glabrata]